MSCIHTECFCFVTGEWILLSTEEIESVDFDLTGKSVSVKFTTSTNKKVIVFDCNSNDLISDPARVEIINSKQFHIIIEDSVNIKAQLLVGDIVIIDDGTGEKSVPFRIHLEIDEGTDNAV